MMQRNDYSTAQPPETPAPATSPNPGIKDAIPCPRCGAIDRPTLTAGSGPHSCKASCAHCGRFLRWISLLSPSERVAHRMKGRLAAMQQNPASAAQLDFLKALGFEGKAPATMAEASEKIEALKQKGGRP